MSARTADSAAPPSSAGAGVIVGIALALMAGAALVAYLFVTRGGPIDGAALLQEAFGVRTIAPEFTIQDARELPSGARIVVLEDAHAPPEPAAVPPSAPKPADGPRTDWKKVAIPPATAMPRRILFLFPEANDGDAALDAAFHTTEWKDIDDLGEEGGQVVLASAKLAWRGFDASWIHERAFEPGGTFRDAVRANLSLAKRPCVMTATWTRGQAASKETLQKILAALTPGTGQ